MTTAPDTRMGPSPDACGGIASAALAESLSTGKPDAEAGVLGLLRRARLGELRGMLPPRGEGSDLARIVAADLSVRDLDGDLADLVALMDRLPAGSWQTWAAAVVVENLAWQLDSATTAIAALALTTLGDRCGDLDLLNRGRLRRALATMYILSSSGSASATSRGLLRQAGRDFRAIGAVEEEQTTACLAALFVALTDPSRSQNQLALIRATLAGGTVSGSDRGPACDYMLAWTAVLTGDAALSRGVVDSFAPDTWGSRLGRESMAKLRAGISKLDPGTASSSAQRSTTPAVEILALSPDLRVRRNGIPVPVGDSGAWLLAILAAKGPQAVPTEWLTERLWPLEDREVRRRRFNNLTHRLRHRLGVRAGELLVRSGDTLRLVPLPSLRVDVWDFRTLTTGGVPDRKRALDLYSSDLCGRQFAYDDDLEAERDDLRRLWTDTAHDLLVHDEVRARDLAARCRALGNTPLRLVGELATRLKSEGLQASALLLAGVRGLAREFADPSRPMSPDLDLTPPA